MKTNVIMIWLLHKYREFFSNLLTKSITRMDEAEALAHVKYTNLKKKVNADSWSTNMELLLKRWAEKAAGLRFMHATTGGEWKKFSDYCSLSAIFVTIIASGASLGAASVDDQDIKDSILIGVGGVGLVSSLIQALKQFYNSEEKTADHLSIAKQFGSFYRYVNLQLAMSREERDPSDILTSYSLKEYERLMSESPSISGSAIEAFHARFKNSEQTKPDIALESFVIDICKDYESTLVLDSKDTDDKDNL